MKLEKTKAAQTWPPLSYFYQKPLLDLFYLKCTVDAVCSNDIDKIQTVAIGGHVDICICIDRYSLQYQLAGNIIQPDTLSGFQTADDDVVTSWIWTDSDIIDGAKDDYTYVTVLIFAVDVCNP